MSDLPSQGFFAIKPPFHKTRRYGDILKKLDENGILNKIPKRIGSDVEFSEDEDDEQVARKLVFTSDDNSTGGVHKEKRSAVAKSACVKGPRKTIEQRMAKKREADELYAETMRKIAEMAAKKKLAKSALRLGSSKVPGKQNLPVQPKAKDADKEVKQSRPEEPNLVDTSGDFSISKFLPNPLTDVFIRVNDKIYNVLSLLGQGSSCKVHAAYDSETQTVVAIKRVDLAKADISVKAGYEKEIEYLEKLQVSDHVIMMHDHEFRLDELFLVLEKGDTDLAKYLSTEKTKKNLTSVAIKFYWSQMLKAVAEIHKHGIVHSDLKPANFLLVAGHLKLIDFGISACVESDKTSVLRDIPVGTLNYTSPEAITTISSFTEEGNEFYKLSVKSDVWSLGCMLYFMVYGYTPFQHICPLMRKMLAIRSPSHVISFLPLKDPLLLDVLKLCLERNVEKRASVQDLLKHQYLMEETELVDSSALQDLIARVRTFTPSRMSVVSNVVTKLSTAKEP